LKVTSSGKYSDYLVLKGKIAVINTSQYTLYRKVIAICSQIHKKYINTLFGDERRIAEF